MEQTTKRGGFGGKLAAILAAAGSAIGLGNIWRFPYITSENGGGAFILIYLGCILFLGLPLLVAELCKVFPSKGECRKMVQGGGVQLNKEKVTDAQRAVAESDLIAGKYLLVQKGKKNYYLITVE